MANPIRLRGLLWTLLALTLPASGHDLSGLYAQIPVQPFAEIRADVEAYYAQRDRGRGSGYKQWKRYEWSHLNSVGTDGRLVNAPRKRVQAITALNEGAAPLATQGRWRFASATKFDHTPLGYNPGIGRINCVAFDPHDARTLYVGAAAGGCWRSDDNGESWTCLTDGLPASGVSGIQVHPDDPDILYILTGDGELTQVDDFSIGVLKSYDGGDTWYETGLAYELSDSFKGSKLRMHPTNPERLYVVEKALGVPPPPSIAPTMAVRPGRHREEPGPREEPGIWNSTPGIPMCSTSRL